MSKATSITLQENIIEYFKDIDDKTFIALIDTFVYHSPIGDNKKISTLIDKFLKDNELGEAYLNYLCDLKDESTKDLHKHFFNRSSMSQRNMIENIKSALLNAAYNRFRKVTTKRDANKNIATELTKLKELVIKFMSPKDTEEFDEAIDELRQMNFKK